MAGKRKAVLYESIPEFVPGAEEATYTEPYRLLHDLLETTHRRIADARANVALVFRKGLKPDKDGRLVLGKCRKASDLEKEVAGLTAYDFVVVLNKEAWEVFDERRRRWLLDHELTHAEFVYEDRRVKRDDRDRPVCRVRGHDLEEFLEVYERHGHNVSAALERFAVTALRKMGQTTGVLFDTGTGEVLDDGPPDEGPDA